MGKFRSIVSAVAAFLLVGSTVDASAQSSVSIPDELVAHCVPLDDTRQVKCDLRFANLFARPKADSVAVNYLPARTPVDVDYKRFPENEDVAWLFLIDRTASMRSPGSVRSTKSNKKRVNRTLAAIQKDVGNILARMRRRHQIGVATFAADLDEMARIGATKSAIDEALDKIELNGQNTALFRRTEEALNLLEQTTGVARKALVLISDGHSEEQESEYYKKNVIDRAKSLGIPIFTIGYRWSKQPLALDTLERLSRDTNGLFFKVDDDSREMPRDVVDSLLEFMETGGTATFPLRPAADGKRPKFEITANLRNSAPLTNEVTLAEPVAPRGLMDWWRLLPSRDKYIYGGGSMAAIVALLGLGMFMMRRRRGTNDFAPGHVITEEVYDNTGDPMPLPGGSGADVTVAPPNTEMNGGFAAPTAENSNKATAILGGGNAASGDAYAWLQRVDSGEQIAIRETAVRIGRHEDNDIRFSEDSIHRRHATIHMTPQREFVVTDLSPSGGNIVEVNGQRVTDKRTLQEGDVIKLGEVSLRFGIVTV